MDGTDKWGEEMSRYIDADALKENFINTDANGINLAIDRYALKCIDDAPTIDAVSVVRCKDCKYKYMYKSVWECPYGLMITADGYCNYGERKESE